jgi:hypothetical protein
MKNLIAAICLVLIGSGSAYAHCHKTNYYAGGGLGFNSQDNSDSTGYQFVGGYCLDFNFSSPKSKTAFEVGYMASGDLDSVSTQGGNGNGNNNTRTATSSKSYQGLWVSGLAEYKLDPKLHLIGRLGYDLGDDDGMIFGTGVGYTVSKSAQVRAEYVARSEVDSFQLNWITAF